MNFKIFVHFGAFLLLSNLVSHIFTILFRGSELCLETIDCYSNFCYLKKKNTKKNIFIPREFCKRTHCPPIVTLALILFICHSLSLEVTAQYSGQLIAPTKGFRLHPNDLLPFWLKRAFLKHFFIFFFILFHKFISNPGNFRKRNNLRNTESA